MLSSLLRILALVRKELQAMMKDPRGRAVLFIPPALQCLVFGYVATFDLNHVPYAVLDRDRSGASSELLAAFDGSGVFQRVENLAGSADVSRVIDERRALVVIEIDQDFERRLMADQPADVQVIADARNSNTAGVTRTGFLLAPAFRCAISLVGLNRLSWFSSRSISFSASSPAARSETGSLPHNTISKRVAIAFRASRSVLIQ